MAVIVNNLGALSAIEMLVMSNEILSQLQLKGIIVVRAYVGAFMTALEVRLHPLSVSRWLQLLVYVSLDEWLVSEHLPGG